MHKPVGKSNTIKGAHMTVQELLKSTTLLERQKMIEQSPLVDMFPDGVPEEEILNQADLSVQPIDLTDAETLMAFAQREVRERYERQLAARERALAARSAAPDTDSSKNLRPQGATERSDVQLNEGSRGSQTPENQSVVSVQ